MVKHTNKDLADARRWAGRCFGELCRDYGEGLALRVFREIAAPPNIRRIMRELALALWDEGVSANAVARYLHGIGLTPMRGASERHVDRLLATHRPDRKRREVNVVSAGG